MTDLNTHFEQSYAFIVGIDQYQHVRPLKTAVSDAVALEKAFTQQGFKVITPLLDEAATKAGMLQLIQQTIPEQLQERNRVIFYFAGHGVAFESEGDPQGFLVPVDAKLDDMDSLLPMYDLINAINNWPCRHGLLIMDCCFAGSLRWSLGTRNFRRRGNRVIYRERFTHYVKDPAWQVLVSAGADQEAVDIMNGLLGVRTGDQHSPFATALLEGLAGLADFGVVEGKQDGLVTATELYIYLRDRVNQMTGDSRVRQTPALFELRRHDKGEFLFLNPKSALNLPPFPERNPYVGLRPYQAEDSLYFHGREEVLERLLTKCLAEPLVVITGGSGVGKSSLLAAGLAPRLQEMGWELMPVFRPGRDPLTKLTVEIPDWKARLQSGNQVFIIDQYEECLAGGLSAAAWQDFEVELAALVQQEIDRRTKGLPAALKIIIAIRSDYELLLQGHPHPLDPTTERWWRKGRLVVPYFSREELLEVIIRPADQAVLFFEPPAFPFTLANDLDGLPGALPLLSLSLSNLYDRFVASGRKDRTLLAADFWAMDGIAGIMASRADQVMDRIGEALLPVVKKIFLRMVQVENGQLTRRRIFYLPTSSTKSLGKKLFNELDYPGSDIDKQVAEVVQLLIEAQLILLTSDLEGQSYLEPVHDTLILYWPKCRQWVEERTIEQLILQNNLWEAVKEYENHIPSSISGRWGEPQYMLTLLWNNNPHIRHLQSELEQGDHWLNQAEKNFIEKSWERRQNEIKQLRALNDQVTQQRDEALRQKAEAEKKGREVQSLALAQLASTEIGKDNSLAYYLAHASFEVIKPNPPSIFATRTLLNLAYSQNPSWPIQRWPRRPSRMALASKSGYLLTHIRPDTLQILDTKGKEMAVHTADLANLAKMHFEPAERFVYIQHTDHRAHLWDYQNQELKDLEEGLKLYWSSDGQYCLQVDATGLGTLYEVQERLEEWKMLWQKKEMGQGYVAKNGSVVASVLLKDVALQFINVEGIVMKEWKSGWAIGFSPQDHYFLISDFPNIHLYDLNAQLLSSYKLVGDLEYFATAGISPSGKYFYIQSMNAAVHLWEVQQDFQLVYRWQMEESFHPTFSPNDRFLVTTNLEYTRVWKMGKKAEIVHQEKSPSNIFLIATEINIWKPVSGMMAIEKPMNLPRFSPDSRYLLFHNVPERFKIIDLYAGREIEIPAYELSEYAFFSADSKHLYVESFRGKLEQWAIRENFTLTLGGQGQSFKWVDCSDDAKYLIGLTNENEISYYLPDGTFLDQIKLEPDWMTVVSPNGAHLVAFRPDQPAMIWHLINGQLQTLNINLGVISELAFATNSLLLLALNEKAKGTLWVWEKESWQQKANSYTEMRKVRFAPKDEFIISIPTYDEVYLWNLNGELMDKLNFEGEKGVPAQPPTLPGGISDFQIVEFFNDNQYAVTKTLASQIRIWKIEKVYNQENESGKQELKTLQPSLQTLSSQDTTFHRVQLSPDGGRLLVYPNNAKHLYVIPVSTLLEVESGDLDPLQEVSLKESVISGTSQDLQGSFGFSPDGKIIYTLYKNYQIQLQSLDELSTTSFHTDPKAGEESPLHATDVIYYYEPWDEYQPVSYIQISPDNQFLFIYPGHHGMASLWNLEGKRVFDFKGLDGSVVFAVFSPDGLFLLTRTYEGTVQRWPMPGTIHRELSAPDFLPALTEKQQQKAGLTG